MTNIDKWIDFCFVVFYMGCSRDHKKSNSNYDNRINYLQRTVTNAFKYSKRVCIFVSNEFDKNIILEHVPNTECIQVECITSTHLPCTACLYVQQHIDELQLKDQDIVYFTEADHLLYIEPNIQSSLVNTLESYDVYASMHRMEQLYQENGKNRGPLCKLHEHEFILANTPHNVHEQPSCIYNNKFYLSKSDVEAYSGAYLTSIRSFKKIKINNNGVLESASFSSFHSLPCMKSIHIKDLYLIHLSGYDYHASFTKVYDARCPVYSDE